LVGTTVQLGFVIGVAHVAFVAAGLAAVSAVGARFRSLT
jgi:hypothetical protein